ncbi:MAG: hypothetical protein JWM81_885 [Candidatus Saccharibacteria bacterium]|nr:hypothetical protein [Candidatus Saccharibacteria bacterium]
MAMPAFGPHHHRRDRSPSVEHALWSAGSAADTARNPYDPIERPEVYLLHTREARREGRLSSIEALGTLAAGVGSVVVFSGESTASDLIGTGLVGLTALSGSLACRHLAALYRHHTAAMEEFRPPMSPSDPEA